MFDIFSKYRLRKTHKIHKASNEDMWSEVFLRPNDSALPDSKQLMGGSLVILYLISIVAVGLLLMRLIFLQVTMADPMREKAYNNHVRIYITRSLRGVIYDAADKLLVENIPRDDIAIVPADLPRDSAQRTEIIDTLADILKISPTTITETLAGKEFLYSPVVISENVDHETKLNVLLAFPEKLYGVTAVPEFYRNYLTETDMSFILGYLGRISQDEWLNSEEDYTFSAEIGKDGIEKSYEQTLRGRNGEQIVNVNAAGKLENVLATSEPVSGCDIRLTIESEMQTEIAAMLQKSLKNWGLDAGVVIVQNPNTGAILSMVSLPTYDHRVMSNGIIGEDEISQFNTWINSKDTPFLHRAISGNYPPGSTYKLVTATAALGSGVVTINDYIDSPGQIVIPSWFDPELTFIYKDWKPSGHGYLNIVGAIAESSDTFFYKATGGFESIPGMGLEAFNHYASLFGMGSKTGIDLPQETSGTLPDEAWKVNVIGENWYVGDTYNLAIGQGYMLTSPLQVASYTSTVANGGTYYKPYVVSSVFNCDNASETEPVVIQSQIATREEIGYVQQGMRQAVTSNTGTAKALKNASVAIAGKTGTAQFNNNEQEHAWFTAYAPYENPEITVTVLLEGGGEGSETAIPLARQVVEYYFSR